MDDHKVIIELRHISKSYEDGNAVVKDLSLQIFENEFLTLLGPSGCGKTTTLRMIGGFESPDSGDIILNNKIINNIPSYARPINTVFQRYALFPHLNVIENVVFGLKNSSYQRLLLVYGEDNLIKEVLETRTKPSDKDPSKSEIKKVIKRHIYEDAYKALELVNLKGYETRKVTQLSGGQMQRVAIARAIINKPKILLLDEPLSALDLKLRQAMHYELKEMQRKLGITFIFVTHDQEEAMTMSDRIVVMNDGIIQQLGTPKEIYNEPKNRFVANFIGETNMFVGKYVRKDLISFEGVQIKCVNYTFNSGEDIDICVRPEDWDITTPSKGQFKATVTSCIFKGTFYEICVDLNGREVVVHDYVEQKVGDVIGLHVDPFEISLMKITENE